MLAKAPLEKLTDEMELALMRRIALFPRLVESAAIAHEPHRIAYYLNDLSSYFHALWTKGAREDVSLRFLNEDDRDITRARLALVKALATVIASGVLPGESTDPSPTVSYSLPAATTITALVLLRISEMALE